MKVILHQDVKGVGRKNDIKTVSDGYARNFLFPKNLGEIATPQAIKRLQNLKLQKEENEKDALIRLKELANKLKQGSIQFKLKAEKDGSTFGSVTKEMIIKNIYHQFSTEDNMEIKLDHPIKKIGEHVVVVDLKKGIEVELKVIVLQQK